MSYPADLKYTKDHEWIRIGGDIAERTPKQFPLDVRTSRQKIAVPQVGAALRTGVGAVQIRKVA